jgi:hypothetical protein
MRYSSEAGRPEFWRMTGFEPPTSSLRTVGKISYGKAPQSLSYFHGALNWQTWQTGFLFVFTVQFDGEKPDKITRGCLCL